MTPAPLETIRWSRRRWIYATGSVFLLQVALATFLGERARPRPAGSQVRSAVYAALDDNAVARPNPWPAVPDATRFALPSHEGFSGAAWLTYPTPEHRFSDWTEPPRWLGLEPGKLTEGLWRYVRTNAGRPLRIADQAVPRLSGLDPDVGNPALRAASEVRLQGELARRGLVSPLALRSWAHTDLLSNTVVRLLVDAQGYALSATLQSESGLPEADQFALKTAEGARFAPRPQPRGQGLKRRNEELDWGELVFEWHTILPAETNAAAAQP